jgi:hypothetical protein
MMEFSLNTLIGAEDALTAARGIGGRVENQVGHKLGEWMIRLQGNVQRERCLG